MITFYPLTSIKESDDIWDKMDNLEAVTVIAMAKMLNEDPNYKLATCQYHDSETKVDIVFTDSLQFVFREFCCPEFQLIMSAELDRLRPGLDEFFQ